MRDYIKRLECRRNGAKLGDSTKGDLSYAKSELATLKYAITCINFVKDGFYELLVNNLLYFPGVAPLDLRSLWSYDPISMIRNPKKLKQKQYAVTVTETVRESFTIVARSQQEAIDTAQSLYRSGKLVLEPGELVKVSFKSQIKHGNTL